MKTEMITPEIMHRLANKIKVELSGILEDVHVTFDTHWQTLNDINYIHCGQLAYPGMREGIIRVYWDRFYDRIAGNGWTYAQDWLFKFDVKDGTCKYYGYPATVYDAVDQFIVKQKKISSFLFFLYCEK